MRLPWVGRLAFDMVVSERDRLREENAELRDSLVRIQRVQAGMRETPRPAAKPEAQQPEPIPEDVMSIIEGFGSKQVRDGLERDAQAMRSAGNPWPKVKQAIERQMGVPA